jgi:hypothetical protein
VVIAGLRYGSVAEPRTETMTVLMINLHTLLGKEDEADPGFEASGLIGTRTVPSC